jgi:ribose 5-phosphate isomerase B
MSILALGCDHAGFDLKEEIRRRFESRGFTVLDFGTFSGEAVDYPDFVIPAALAVAQKRADFGIVIGGSGNGEAIAANKVKGIRCALCWNEASARLAKEHNDANLISLGARMLSVPEAINIVEAWIGAAFQGGRHSLRIRKISDYEAG